MYPHVVEDNLIFRRSGGEDNHMLRVVVVVAVNTEMVMVLRGPHNQVNVCGHQMRQKCKNLTSKITLCLCMQGCSYR